MSDDIKEIGSEEFPRKGGNSTTNVIAYSVEFSPDISIPDPENPRCVYEAGRWYPLPLKDGVIGVKCMTSFGANIGKVFSLNGAKAILYWAKDAMGDHEHETSMYSFRIIEEHHEVKWSCTLNSVVVAEHGLIAGMREKEPGEIDETN
jgi:hypothetical protein